VWRVKATRDGDLRFICVHRMRNSPAVFSNWDQFMPGPTIQMTLLNTRTLETAAGVALIASVAAGAVWWVRRKRPAPDEVERARRTLLANSGRLVDGMLLDVCEMETADGRKLTLLEYSYRIGGADYECSQDITTMLNVIDPVGVRAGFPCSVRYQQSSPQNSIVVAEGWSGLRERLPDLPHMRKTGPVGA
jgi:hypothetical protein